MSINPKQLERSDLPRVATAVVCSQCGRVEHDLRAHTSHHIDDAARRLRRLVRGFLDRVTG